jgi:hypothetical protein
MRKPGHIRFAQTGEDQVTASWEGADGSLVELDLDLADMAPRATAARSTA